MSKRKKQPATPEQRAAMTFPAVDVRFDWTNENWGLAFLPRVRIATLALQRDDKALQEFMAHLAKKGLVPDLLEGWCITKEHLKTLTKMLDMVTARSFVVLERLGYTPDNPPPESRVN